MNCDFYNGFFKDQKKIKIMTIGHFMECLLIYVGRPYKIAYYVDRTLKIYSYSPFYEVLLKPKAHKN